MPNLARRTGRRRDRGPGLGLVGGEGRRKGRRGSVVLFDLGCVEKCLGILQGDVFAPAQDDCLHHVKVLGESVEKAGEKDGLGDLVARIFQLGVEDVGPGKVGGYGLPGCQLYLE